MKRILALILSFVLIFCSVADVFAAAASDELSESYEANELLYYLDIFEREDDLSEVVTRADFASYIAKLIKVDSAEIGKQYYKDIPAEMWVANSVNALTALGYFSGGGDATFRPEDGLRFSEAIKVVMCMIGYRELCEAKGGFPTGYVSVASQLRLIDQYSDDFVTRQQLAVLLYYALIEPMYVMQSVGSDRVEYAVDENKTILSAYHNIYYTEGVVNAAGEIALDSTVDISQGYADVGGITVSTRNLATDMFDYLGMTVKMFYECNDGKNSASLVFPYGSYNNIVEINNDAMMTINDYGSKIRFTYTDEKDTERYIEIPRGCVVIKNGESVKSNLLSELKIKNGSYRFLDYNADKKYDVLFVKSYYNLFVGQVQNQEGMHYISFDGSIEHYRGPVGSTQVIYDAYDSSLKIDVTESDDRIIKIKDANGNLDSLNKIGTSEVISVFASASGNYVEIYRGRGKVKGRISMMETTDAQTKTITIGEDSYDIDPNVIERMQAVLTPGFDGVFYLDFSGKVGAYTASTDSGMVYGYLIGASYVNRGLDDELSLKLFDANGKLAVYECADIVKIDSVSQKTTTDIYAAIHPHQRELVRFSTNADGKINAVDTITTTEGEDMISLRRTSKIDFARYSSTLVGFADNDNTSSDHYTKLVKASTLVFLVPTDTTLINRTYDESWFQVSNRSVLKGDAQYPNVTTYRMNPNGGYEDAVVIKNDGRLNLPTLNPPLLISSVSKGLDSEGNAVNIIEAYGESKNVQKYETTNANVLSGYDLKRGDFVWFDFDPNGKIRGVIDIIVDCEDTLSFKIKNAASAVPGNYYAATITAGDDLSTLRGSTVRGSMSVAWGYAGDITDGVIRFAYTQEDCAAENYVMARNISNAVVLVYDREIGKDGRIYWSSASDIVDYRRGGADCDRVVLSMRQGAVKCVIVYK